MEVNNVFCCHFVLHSASEILSSKNKKYNQKKEKQNPMSYLFWPLNSFPPKLRSPHLLSSHGNCSNHYHSPFLYFLKLYNVPFEVKQSELHIISECGRTVDLYNSIIIPSVLYFSPFPNNSEHYIYFLFIIPVPYSFIEFSVTNTRSSADLALETKKSI